MSDRPLLPTRMAFWRWHVETRTMVWHKGLHALIGRVPETYEEAVSVVYVDDRPLFETLLRNAYTEQTEQMDVVRVMVGRSLRELEVRLYPEKADSDVTHVVGWMWDIAELRCERELLEEQRDQLSRKDRLLQRLQTSAQIGGWEVDLATHRLYWTPETARLHGLSEGTPAPSLMEVLFLYTESSQLKIRAAVVESLQHEQNLDLTVDLRHPSRTLRITGEMIREDSHPITISGAVQDITELRRAERSLQEAQSRYHRALEAVGTGIWEWNVQTNERHLSPGFMSLLGHSPADLSRDEFLENVVHPEDMDLVVRTMDDHLRGETDLFSIEYRWRHASGEWRWTLGRGRISERDEHGAPLIVVGSNIDVTLRKTLEEQLLTSMKMEGIGRLAGGIAHDFNNLLTAILGHTELLKDRCDLPPDVVADILQISDAGKRAANLTGQLLAFARQRPIKPRIVDLGALVQGIENLLKRLVGEHIRISIQLARDVWFVEIDPGQFEQILVNLVVNGRDAMPEGGTLELRLENIDVMDEQSLELTPGPHVMISLRDQGEGMDETTLARIFEPFFTTKPQGEGTGLGLATSYGIVKQAKGSIEVLSTKGIGTTFRIYLPARRPSVIETKQFIVLVVEDDPLVRDVTMKVLEREGFHVIGAATPKRAIEITHDLPRPIDVLVSDVALPEMNGFQLARLLREEHHALGIVFVSGYSRDSFANEDMKDMRFLAKPFTPQSLLEAVRSATSPPRQND